MNWLCNSQWIFFFFFKVDVWAMGVIVYILLCGYPPFVSPTNDQEELFDSILAGTFDFAAPYWDGASDSAKDLITLMLQTDSDLRFSACEVLQHPWLTVYPSLSFSLSLYIHICMFVCVCIHHQLMIWIVVKWGKRGRTGVGLAQVSKWFVAL